MPLQKPLIPPDGVASARDAVVAERRLVDEQHRLAVGIRRMISSLFMLFSPSFAIGAVFRKREAGVVPAEAQ
jgi:hypothetical protein